MRRWNGWGDDTITYPLPAIASGFLGSAVGAGTPPVDAALDQVLAGVPASRLPAHPLVSTDPLERVRHARGQSLPDWVAMRSGRVPAFPDGVSYPTTQDDVRELIAFARSADARLIPYGGGTSVVGHVNAEPGGAPVLTVDLSRISQLLRLDGASQLATFGAGISGPDLEAQLRARGFTLGHFPQSFEYSTLGGWVVTRSSGQQSLGYGRIEQLFAGGRVLTPEGTLDLPSFPASAAGPDLREAVLGSEGRMGILTEASVRVTPLPEREEFHGVFFPDWGRAIEGAREVVQSRLPLSMLRLSTPVETETTIALARHKRFIGALETLLSALGAGSEKCLFILGFHGNDSVVRASRKEAIGIGRKHGGVHVGQLFGRLWHKNRFRMPYLRNSLWELGYAVDTLETATTWANVPAMLPSIHDSLSLARAGIDEKVHVFSHLSHCYPTGSSIYTTYLFRIARDPEETLHRWRLLKSAASNTIVANGGTISHQHGVGADHLPYLRAEKGDLGMKLITGLCRELDPRGLMNPGKLVD
ncbi:MAG: FAD-binding oxidoreductase [Acidobacteriota bacterium]